MLYSVMQVSESVGLSKQSIYKKLKAKELQDNITKKQGVTYINEVGFNIIRDGLKYNIDGLNELNDEKVDTNLNDSITGFKENLNVNQELLNLLKDQLSQKDVQLKTKDIQLDEKDNQIHDLHKLIENSQVLLKDKPNQDILQLEEHFQELEIKLEEVKENMNDRKEQQRKSIFDKFFKKYT